MNLPCEARMLFYSFFNGGGAGGIPKAPFRIWVFPSTGKLHPSHMYGNTE